MSSFAVVGEREAEEQKPVPPEPKSNFAADALVLALKALSQRAIVALANLFMLLTVGSAFWLWMSIPDPTVLQLISLGMYALFVLAVNFIARR